MKSRKTKIELEIITEMFSSGAEKQKFEFRIPELKSAMRFWWRALGSFEDIEAMKEKEGALFGDSKTNSSPLKINFYESRDHILKGKEKEKIKLNLCLRRNAEKDIEWYENLIKIVSILGGLGKNSRKGSGCFCINNYEVNNTEKIFNLIDKLFPEIYKLESNVISRKQYLKLDYGYVKKIIIHDFMRKDKDIAEAKRLAKRNSKFNKVHNTSRRYASPRYISIAKKDSQSNVIIITILNTIKEPQNDSGLNNYEDLIKREAK